MTEVDVARLVALGVTNPQIAGRLPVSPRTIQTHVTHILMKLGPGRRTEIAAQVSRRTGWKSGLDGWSAGAQ